MSGPAGSLAPAGLERHVWNWGSVVAVLVGPFVAAGGLACSDTGVGLAENTVARPVRVELNRQGAAGDGWAVEVFGLPSGALSTLGDAALTPDEWAGWLRISVADTGEKAWGLPPVLGRYSVSDEAIYFTPLFDFDPGRFYRVMVDPSRLPTRVIAVTGIWPSGPIEETVGVPALELEASTTVVEVYPTTAVVPENLLRFYISFSAPMSLDGGADHVRLLDGSGHDVEEPFLPLDVALWNEDRTRYTLLLDPGRVKRGILPNVRMGRAIAEGSTYTLVVDRDWRDASGLPLVEPFHRSFRVTAPDERAIDQTEWQMIPPQVGSRDPVTVSFARPLDHALLRRALRVATGGGEVLTGDLEVGAGEMTWTFWPRQRWETQEYHLVVLPTLEDPAGNRVGRSFEAAGSAGHGRRGAMSGYSLPFLPRPPAP